MSKFGKNKDNLRFHIRVYADLIVIGFCRLLFHVLRHPVFIFLTWCFIKEYLQIFFYSATLKTRFRHQLWQAELPGRCVKVINKRKAFGNNFIHTNIKYYFFKDLVKPVNISPDPQQNRILANLQYSWSWSLGMRYSRIPSTPTNLAPGSLISSSFAPRILQNQIDPTKPNRILQ